ncbi:MAG TPA: hypothetical protein VIW24_24635 [Aldersonia sp.]
MRAVTVAAGVFAPGHLGELTRQVPAELVEAVLEQTRTRSGGCGGCRRGWVSISFWRWAFSPVGYPKVWAKLVTGLDGGPSVSGKALQPSGAGCGSADTGRWL